MKRVFNHSLTTSSAKAEARKMNVQHYTELTGNHRMPNTDRYYTLAADQTSIGSELSQLMASGFLMPQQFVGIDRDHHLCEANAKAYPQATWLSGEWLQVLSQFGSRLKPGVVYLDTMQCVDHPYNLRLLAGTMRRCAPGTVLCYNAVARIPQRPRYILNHAAPLNAIPRLLTPEEANRWDLVDGHVYQAGKTPMISFIYHLPTAYLN